MRSSGSWKKSASDNRNNGAANVVATNFKTRAKKGIKMTTSFHKSNLGQFGESLPCDMAGFVHLTAADWMHAPMDWGYPSPTDEDKAAQCEELASQAREATAAAEEALARWQAAH